MNCFLKAHENLSIDELINSLKNSLDNHNRAAILALCFIIPDLLSKNMGNNKKENYIKWFDDNIKVNYYCVDEINNDIISTCLNGKLFYALRCSFLHAGNTEITKRHAKDAVEVEFVYDNDIEFPVGIESYGKIEYDGKTIKKVRLNVEKIANVFIKYLQSYERK